MQQQQDGGHQVNEFRLVLGGGGGRGSSVGRARDSW